MREAHWRASPVLSTMKPLRVPLSLLPLLALVTVGVAAVRADDAVPPAAVAAAAVVPAGATPAALVTPPPAIVTPPPVIVTPPAAASPAPPAARLLVGDARLDAAQGRYVAPLGDGHATLTLDPRLQARLERSLETYRVPYGATVLIEPRTGRVLAMAEHSRVEPSRKGLALAALAPAASVFKIVTAAALLEKGVGVEGETCYHGGKRRLDPKLLRDDPRRDRRCVSLSSAFGHSTNVVFAKLADRDLDPGTLRGAAERFLFNVPISFARPVEVSTAEVPDDPFAAANTAAGFGAVRLSPLHGALLAAIVANGGVFVPPVLVDEAVGAAAPEPPPPWRVVDEQVAARLAAMMRETVSVGTAHKAFRRLAGPMRGVHVAGKTGSLSDKKPFRDYSWFVGFAPAERPEVAVATVIVNDRLWHARAPAVAREALEAFFATRVAALPPGSLRTASLRRVR
jgi:cell division protein FtsI/penicillin-binding protein 2